MCWASFRCKSQCGSAGYGSALAGSGTARRGAARNQRGGDDDVLLGDVRADQFGLRLLVFRAHLGRIAARAFAFDPRDILDEDRLGAERLDLLLSGRAHVSRGNLRAETASGGDGLKPGHAHAHDKRLGGRDRARRRHHHRQRQSGRLEPSPRAQLIRLQGCH